MALDGEEHPSRWQLFIEARDSLRGILAPSLSLRHLLANGPRIARRARVNRPERPLQSVRLNEIATHRYGNAYALRDPGPSEKLILKSLELAKALPAIYSVPLGRISTCYHPTPS